MPHILPRRDRNGQTRYTAVVRIRKSGRLLHREAKTFSHRSAAERWARAREVALEDPTALARGGAGSETLATLIRWYIDTFEEVSKWQRSKQTHLKFLEHHDIGTVDPVALTEADLIRHVQSRRADGAGPATALNDLVWIGVVLRAARSVKGVRVNPSIVKDAQAACRALRLTAKAKRRSRRPTAEELARLDEYFGRRDGRAEIPMRDIMWFAIHSARRQAEICRILWSDNDSRAKTGMVRDAKHPTHREGNHRRFKYTPDAWAIVERQPRTSERIFPFDSKSVCAAFTHACQFLEIRDLRFHDLRHEATSRLFERGYQIHEVAQFTLHDSWNELKRYANLRPENVREITSAPPQSNTAATGASQTRARRSSTARGCADDQSAQLDLPRSPATATSARRA